MKCAFETPLKTLAIGSIAAWLLAGPEKAFAFRRISEGDRLFDHKIYSAEGKESSLSKNLGPKATLILFWASWSPRSVEALADFGKMAERLKEKGLSSLAVNVEHQSEEPGDREAIAAALKSASVNYPSYIDRGLEIYNAIGVSSTPSIVVADSELNVKILLSGYPTIMRDEFAEKVENLLGDGAKNAAADGVEVSSQSKSVRYYQTALVFRKKGMPHKAVESLKKALEIEPGHRDSLNLVAELLEKVGDQKSADEYRERLK